MKVEAGTCKFCDQPFVRERIGPGRPLRYCNDVCRKGFDARQQRLARQKQKPVPEVRLAERELVCYCGAELTGIGYDRLGRTMEICAQGHETLALIRRSA